MEMLLHQIPRLLRALGCLFGGSCGALGGSWEVSWRLLELPEAASNESIEKTAVFICFRGAREAPGTGQPAPARQQPAEPSRQKVPPYKAGQSSGAGGMRFLASKVL